MLELFGTGWGRRPRVAVWALGAFFMALLGCGGEGGAAAGARREHYEAAGAVGFIVLALIVPVVAVVACRRREAALRRAMRQAELESLKAIQESRNELKTVFDNLPIGIAVISTSAPARFEYMNDPFAAIHRTTRDKLADPDAFWEAVYEDPEFRQELKDRVLEDCASGDPARMRWDGIPITRGGEETHYISVTNTPLPDMGVVVSTVWDITERKRSEEQIRCNETRLRGLVSILQYRAKTTQEFLDNALNEAIKLTESKIGYIFFYHEDKKLFVLNTWSLGVMAQCTIRESHDVYELDKTGLWGEAVRQRKPIILNDFTADHPRKRGYPEGHAPLTKFMTVPVFREGQIVAVVGVANKAEDYDESDVLQLTLLMDAVWKFVDIKRAEEELCASEARYRTLFDKAIEGIALSDPETGALLDCNEAFLELTGYAKAELVGRPLTVLDPPEAGRGDPAAISGNGGRVSEKRLLTKSGPLKEVAVKAHILEIAGQKVVQESFRDVTETRRGRREREAMLELLRLLNDRSQLHELIRMVLGLLQNWTGCEAVGIRLREGEDFPYCESRGFDPEFIRGENLLCRRDAEGRPVRDETGNLVLECMCGRILRGRIGADLPYSTPNGSFWTNGTTELMAGLSDEERRSLTRSFCTEAGYESVALIPLRHGDQIIGLIQLNDRAPGRFTPELVEFMEQLASQLAVAVVQRQAEDALRDSEEKFRRLLEGIQNEYFLYQEDRNGVYTYLSPSVSNVLGWAPEECMVHYSESMTDSIINKVAMRHSELTLAGEPQPPFEVAVKHKDGSSRHLEVFEIPLFDRAGNVTSVEGIARNISERKRAEEERGRLEAQLRQAQKMESVGRLAGGVAHDFNNMLNVIVGYSEMALDRLGEDDPMRRFFQEILSAAERSAGLTRQLLAFARKQTIAPRVLNLNSTIEGMLNMLGRLIGEDTRLEWQPAASLWPVMMDPAQIDQILANLVVNARDAITGVGRITIRTSNVEVGESYGGSRDGALPGPYVLVEVSDTGCGMDREALSHLFEPFFTTKAKGQGTGLGLATVYGIVKQNNGFIDVRSEPGQGATFDIHLPRHEVGGDAADAPRIAAGTPRGTETVLLVEDEAALLKLATYMLENLGYTVLASKSPGEAIEIFRKHQGKIHLLLTDIIMPEMSGRDLQRRLHELKPDIKCLFMSGYTADVIAHRGVLDRGVHFLQKPFTLEMLAAKMREAVLSD